MAGILSDSAIQKAIESGDIEIDPYEPKHLNITSYDLTLGDEVRVYSGAVSPIQVKGETFLEPIVGRVLDSRLEQRTDRHTIGPNGFTLHPGIGYLMHTRERVCTKRYNPILDGKSSIGRLFIQVHATAGYGDPGFSGQYTLEVIVQHPVKVYAGMRFCQIRFHTIEGELSRTYAGHYTGEQAKGAIPSQAWRQFQK